MILGLSVLAVLLLTGIAWAMGFRDRPTLDAVSARDEAEARLAGFRVAEVELARDGRGAVLRGHDGSLAMLLPFGDGWLSRKLPPGTRLVHAHGVVTAQLGEPMLGQARLPLVRLPDWLQDGVA